MCIKSLAKRIYLNYIYINTLLYSLDNSAVGNIVYRIFTVTFEEFVFTL